MKILFLGLLLLGAVIGPAKALATKPSLLNCYKLMEPGQTVWGTYQCKSCGSEVYAEPNSFGRQQCRSCPAAHTDEAYSPPHHVKRFVDGESRLFVLVTTPIVTEDSLSETFAKSGVKWICPFCATDNFKVQGQCVGCAAPIEMGKEADNDRGAVMQTDQPTAATDLPVAQLTDVTSSPVVVDASAHSGRTTEVSDRKRTLKDRLSATKPWQRWSAAGALAASLGTVFWGAQTESHFGTVTEVNAGSVIIKVEGVSEKNQTVELAPNGQETIAWRKGEQVEVFYRNFGGMQGAERSNGATYVPHRLRHE